MTSRIHAMLPPFHVALHVAVFCNNVNLVDRLIKGGADVNARDEVGKIPLMGIIPNHFSNNPYAPLSIAKLLVEHGTNVNVHDKDGNTSLHHQVSWYCVWKNLKQAKYKVIYGL